MTPEFLSPEKQACGAAAWKALCEGKHCEIDQDDLMAFLAYRFIERANRGDMSIPLPETEADS